MASWASLKDGRTRAVILADILAALQGIGFRVDDWSVGGVVRTLIDVAFSGAMSAAWDGIASVTKGGFLRLAQELAEAQIDDWDADPTGHWLYLLAVNLYGTTPKLAEFTVGTVKYTNNGAGAQTITPSHVVTNTAGLRYAPLAAATALPAGASVYVPVQAESPGSAYDVGEGAITILTTSLPGVTVRNEAQAPALSWITTYGADTESPKELADRCSERWSRLTQLQAIPADGYKSLAKEAATQVRKVAVWPNYSHLHAGFWANTVTLYLGGETGPVDGGVVNGPTSLAVIAALTPYIGLHDVLEVRPCGTQTMTISGTISVATAALIPVVKAAVEAALVADEATLDIGQTVHAWRIRTVVAVDGVKNFVEALVDFVPAKNALVDYNYAGLVYVVGT